VPRPGAQLRLVECNGRRITCFVANISGWHMPDLKLRLRRRAPAEDRIRCVKDIGLANLPFRDAASNAVWLAIVLLACDLLTWTQTLSLSGSSIFSGVGLRLVS
jgi:Transposase DDE domain group 1